MPRTRAYRRHARRRLLRKWERIAKRWGITDDNTRNGVYGWIVRTMGNMPMCSDPGCCGNPRRRGEKTRQENRADDAWKDRQNENSE